MNEARLSHLWLFPPWLGSQALTVTQGSSDITLIPSSTEFKMAQVIKFPIKRWESVQGRGIEQAHWLKPSESPQHTARGGSITTRSNWYTSFVFDLVLLWLLSPSACFSVAAGAHRQFSWASVIESAGIMTRLHESGNLIRQDCGFISIL